MRIVDVFTSYQWCCKCGEMMAVMETCMIMMIMIMDGVWKNNE